MSSKRGRTILDIIVYKSWRRKYFYGLSQKKISRLNKTILQLTLKKCEVTWNINIFTVITHKKVYDNMVLSRQRLENKRLSTE